MKLKIDENLPVEVASDLRLAGFDADTVLEEGIAGIEDNLLLQLLVAEERVLITLDKGIADVRIYPPEQYSGIVLLRPASTGRGTVREFARRWLPDALTGELKGHLLVISDAGIRIR